MHTEYELRILNINKASVVKKLESIGAQKKHEELLQRRYVMDFADGRLGNKNAWLRLRQVGDLRVECTIKQRIDNTSVKNAREINCEISDLEKARELFEFIGLEVKRYQENKRISFRKGRVSYDIDSWPGVLPYVEVESDNETDVREAVKELGYTPADCVYTAGTELLRHLGFSETQMRDLRFDQ